MKVLVVHNRYRSDAPSGENVVVDRDVALLRAAGVEVAELIADSDRLVEGGARALVRAAPGPVYSPDGVRRFARTLAAEAPDLVHLHNVYPLVSPWVVRTSRQHGTPVVHTAHNFRLTCISANHFRDGAPCHDCQDGPLRELSGVVHGCYRGSRAQSAVMTLGQRVHRRTWRDGVARWIAPSRQLRDHLERSGVPAERLVVRANPVADPGEPTPPGTDFVFLGRLDAAKGIRELLDAWELAAPDDARLVVAGGGELEAEVRDRAARAPDVEYVGVVDAEQRSRLLRAARAVVVPSIAPESFGLVAAEAFAHGRGVVTTGAGALAEIVDDRTGWLCEPTARGIADALLGVSPSVARAKGDAARQTYRAQLSPDATTGQLLDIYSSVRGGEA